jgi:vacuolar-type H+-ATPase subunit I/STV1
MNTTSQVNVDQRHITSEASYRMGYLFISFGLLLVVAYRSFMNNESPWDLLGLVIGSGIVCGAYQWHHKALSARLAATFLLTFILSAVLAALVVFLR